MEANKKRETRKKIIKLKQKRIRKRIFGKSKCPRLTIYKSNTSLIAQIIDDEKQKTLVFGSCHQKNKEGAKELAKIICEKAKKAKIKHVVFDRAGRQYLGIIKLFADTCRDNGLMF